MKNKLPKKNEFWWVLFLEGIIQLVLGLLLIFSTDMTVFLLIQLLGIYWLIRGIIMIIQVFVTKEKSKGWLLFGGILGLLAGVLVLRYPIFSGFVVLEFLFVFIAIVGLIQGTISLVHGVSRNNVGEVLLGIVLWIVCLLLFSNPLSSMLALPIAIGIIWLIGGTTLAITAYSVRK